MVASLKIKGKLNQKIIKGYAIPAVLIIFEINFLRILSAATPKRTMVGLRPQNYKKIES